MEKLMRQVEQGTQLTGEAQEWMERAVALLTAPSNGEDADGLLRIWKR